MTTCCCSRREGGRGVAVSDLWPRPAAAPCPEHAFLANSTASPRLPSLSKLYFSTDHPQTGHISPPNTQLIESVSLTPAPTFSWFPSNHFIYFCWLDRVIYGFRYEVGGGERRIGERDRGGRQKLGPQPTLDKSK